MCDNVVVIVVISSIVGWVGGLLLLCEIGWWRFSERVGFSDKAITQNHCSVRSWCFDEQHVCARANLDRTGITMRCTRR